MKQSCWSDGRGLDWSIIGIYASSRKALIKNLTNASDPTLPTKDTGVSKRDNATATFAGAPPGFLMKVSLFSKLSLAGVPIKSPMFHQTENFMHLCPSSRIVTNL